ncbi:MAG: hypothetical protein FWG99_02150 [Treponema sp.]|nr:hypothetical protein [Treponema sp.]
MVKQFVEKDKNHPSSNFPKNTSFPFSFAVKEKFAAIDGQSLYTELSLFRAEGPPAPYTPLRLLKGSLDIERMDESERAFYIYWRAEFRRRNILKTDEKYIRIYARELCLFSGGEKEFAENFRQLEELWKYYGDVFDDIGGFLPGWLLDFIVLYEMPNTFITGLLPHVRGCSDLLLVDILIYKSFIEENNTIAFNDIKLLLRRPLEKSIFFDRYSSRSGEFAGDFETVINAIDRNLRENDRLGLFEYFCPRSINTENRKAFAGMERAGHSSYTVTGRRFSKNISLISFLENLFDYVEHCFRIKNDYKTADRPPHLADRWKRMADHALTQININNDGLIRLRSDSDIVRDMLTVEEKETEVPDTPPRIIKAAKTKPVKISFKTFIKKLDKNEIQALRIIAGEDENKAAMLASLARENNTMPDMLIDKINAAFMEAWGDLLINTVDAQAVIQSEYREELFKLL